MTRKDYKLIAEVLNDAVQDCMNGTEEDIIFMQKLVLNMANALQSDNPRFLYKRFYDACGLHPKD